MIGTVKELRETKNITQKQMAVLTGIPYSTYVKKELGCRRWYLDELAKVCKVLGCGINEIKYKQ